MIVFVILLLLLRFKALGDVYFLQLGIFKKVTVYLIYVHTLKMTGQQRKPGC